MRRTVKGEDGAVAGLFDDVCDEAGLATCGRCEQEVETVLADEEAQGGRRMRRSR